MSEQQVEKSYYTRVLEFSLDHDPTLPKALSKKHGLMA